jgi:hypothetical protein
VPNGFRWTVFVGVIVGLNVAAVVGDAVNVISGVELDIAPGTAGVGAAQDDTNIIVMKVIPGILIDFPFKVLPYQVWQSAQRI